MSYTCLDTQTHITGVCLCLNMYNMFFFTGSHCGEFTTCFITKCNFQVISSARERVGLSVGGGHVVVMDNVSVSAGV